MIMIISIKVSVLNCSQALNATSITNQSIPLWSFMLASERVRHLACSHRESAHTQFMSLILTVDRIFLPRFIFLLLFLFRLLLAFYTHAKSLLFR